MLQQVGKAEAGVLQHAGGLPRVEHVDREEAEVPLQPQHVAVRAMQHLQNAGVGKDCGELRPCSGTGQLNSMPGCTLGSTLAANESVSRAREHWAHPGRCAGRGCRPRSPRS